MRDRIHLCFFLTKDIYQTFQKNQKVLTLVHSKSYFSLDKQLSLDGSGSENFRKNAKNRLGHHFRDKNVQYSPMKL